jgi:TolA-binding protein
MVKSLFVFAALAIILPAGIAQAQPVIQSQEGIALENQILQLQQQMQQLQAGGNGGSMLGGGQPPAPPQAAGPAPNGSLVTTLLNQVGQLQSEVQQLSGRVDTLQNQVNTQHDEMEKEIGDLNFKLSGTAAAGAGAGAAAGANAGPGGGFGQGPGPQNLNNAAPQPAMAPPPPPPAQAAAPNSPRATLHAAQTAYANRDYPTAESLAHGIIAHAGSSPEAYQAQYLLAQSLAAEGKPQDAAIAFDNAYNRNRSGPYAPQSLLGLANSLAAIHQNEAACDTLSSLSSQFPSPPAGMQSRIDAASHRAHCS